jgi:predicted transglutaminase-like cysteine proteinase
MKDLAQKIKDQVDPLFQGEKGDWGSHADEVQQGKEFSGDCKAYSMTCAALLLMQGAEPEKVKIVYCTIKDKPHMVCACDIWVIDNLSDKVMYWNDLDYEWISSMRMNEPGTWRSML